MKSHQEKQTLEYAALKKSLGFKLLLALHYFIYEILVLLRILMCSVSSGEYDVKLVVFKF